MKDFYVEVPFRYFLVNDEEDFEDFIRWFLAEKGIHYNVHYLCKGIAAYDKVYVNGELDRFFVTLGYENRGYGDDTEEQWVLKFRITVGVEA